MSDKELTDTNQQSATKGKYYIHDTTRGCVGSCMIWWKRGHLGYTTDIREAHVFDESELKKYLGADDLAAYPVEYINGLVRHHIDMLFVDKNLGRKK